jgi:HEAT repeat protein
MNLKSFRDLPSFDWPQGAKEQLVQTLRGDGAESERLLAAELAGEVGVIDEELVAALLSVVENDKESENLRSQAAIALGPVIDEMGMEELAESAGMSDPEGTPISKETYDRVQQKLRSLYTQAEAPKLVRRRALEASVRAPQDWHEDVIRAAYASGDPGWMRTAVFSMRWVSGFDDTILEALQSDDDEVHRQAVSAAGDQELDPAWPHVAELVSPKTDKPLLLAAMEAAANIRPEEAGPLLVDLSKSSDEEIAEAADEAMMMADMAGIDDDEALR